MTCALHRPVATGIRPCARGGTRNTGQGSAVASTTSWLVIASFRGALPELRGRDQVAEDVLRPRHFSRRPAAQMVRQHLYVRPAAGPQHQPVRIEADLLGVAVGRLMYDVQPHTRPPMRRRVATARGDRAE